MIAIPPTETSFTKYFSQIPAGTDAIYHVMVGPGGAHLRAASSASSSATRGRSCSASSTHWKRSISARRAWNSWKARIFWEAFPRYLSGLDTENAKFYRSAVGIDENGASVDNAKEVATNSHMFGCWETLFSIKEAVEASGYKGAGRQGEAGRGDRGHDRLRRRQGPPPGQEAVHRQGAPDASAPQFISKVEGGKLNVVHTTSIEDGLYEPAADYTKQPL